MGRKTALLVFAGLIAVCFSSLSFAQEAAPEAAAAQKPVPTEWLYGETVSVDIAGKSLTLTYLDYDTDIEKQAVVYVNDKTAFENVKTLEDVKAQDMVSIDYVVGADGKNMAVTISVEKPENFDDLRLDESVPAEAAPGIKPAVETPAAAPAETAPAEAAPAEAAPEKEAGVEVSPEPVKAQ